MFSSEKVTILRTPAEIQIPSQSEQQPSILLMHANGDNTKPWCSQWDCYIAGSILGHQSVIPSRHLKGQGSDKDRSILMTPEWNNSQKGKSDQANVSYLWELWDQLEQGIKTSNNLFLECHHIVTNKRLSYRPSGFSTLHALLRINWWNGELPMYSRKNQGCGISQ